jgi:hypothetical protein
MNCDGSTADLLRTIGRMLDRCDARQVDMVRCDGRLTMSWTSSEGQTERAQHEADDLCRLTARARAKRGCESMMPSGPRSRCLRTLGQELDKEGIRFQSIFDYEDGLLVGGECHGRYAFRWYTVVQLEELDHQRREQRVVHHLRVAAY